MVLCVWGGVELRVREGEEEEEEEEEMGKSNFLIEKYMEKEEQFLNRKYMEKEEQDEKK